MYDGTPVDNKKTKIVFFLSLQLPKLLIYLENVFTI